MDLGDEGKEGDCHGRERGHRQGGHADLGAEGVDVAICARRKEPLEEAADEIAKATGAQDHPHRRRSHEGRRTRKSS